MKTIPFQFYVEPEIKERLERLAKEEGVSMSRLVRDLLTEQLDRVEAGEPHHPQSA